MTSKYVLRGIALGYLGLLIAGPVGVLVWQTFAGGVGPVWEALTRPAAIHAFQMTLLIAVIVVPLNTVFGVLCALVIARHQFRGKAILNTILDLPLAVSPVVVGLALLIVYGRTSFVGGWLAELGIRVIFSVPGIILATVFISLPFVVREVVPVLLEIGEEQERAAETLGAGRWQTFRRITLPSIRWGVTYGIVLTVARCLGEYGAVAVVSGRIAGRTETLTLRVEERFQAFDLTAAYATSILLAALAILTLMATALFGRRKEHEHGH